MMWTHPLPADFALRRQALCDGLTGDEALLVCTSPEILRTGDSHFPFRPHSDFYYLTGVTEPDACAVLLPDGEGSHTYILLSDAADPEAACWHGPRMGQLSARRIYGADEAYPLDDWKVVLNKVLAGRDTWWVAMDHHPIWAVRLQGMLSEPHRGLSEAITCRSLSEKVHAMRLIKSGWEIEQMVRAADVGGAAHIAVMSACRPGLSERDLTGLLWQVMLAGGAQEPAYPHIVAAGKNACVLHYTQGQAPLQDGELLLVDAGAEWGYYASDITRTMPINGTFSAPQQAVYELVLATQLQVINMIRPGVAWRDLQQATATLLTQGMVDLGILVGDVKELVAKEAYRAFYMHGVGHWLGLDVHDVGGYGQARDRRLKPGMVLTVEPGLYLNPARGPLSAKWHHIGVRIEDDILVTETGARVLSQDVPKTPDDIHRVMHHKGA